jgi:hypothetical protein
MIYAESGILLQRFQQQQQ